MQCRYGRKCRRPDCHFEHPEGREIESTAITTHPRRAPSSQTPCRFGRKCHRPDCYYAHPDGRAIEDGQPTRASGPKRSQTDVDKDAWFPAARDCACCSGYVYGCKQPVCVSFGICACSQREVSRTSPSESFEEALQKEFVPSQAQCTCCKGYVYACTDATCRVLGCCYCFMESAGGSPQRSATPEPYAPEPYTQKPLSPAELREVWVPTSRECVCCNGYVHACTGVSCTAGVCRCVNAAPLTATDATVPAPADK